MTTPHDTKASAGQKGALHDDIFGSRKTDPYKRVIRTREDVLGFALSIAEAETLTAIDVWSDFHQDEEVQKTVQGFRDLLEDIRFQQIGFDHKTAI